MKAFRMCASYNLLGKLLSPYHLHVYNLCNVHVSILHSSCMYEHAPVACLRATTPSHSALNQQTPEIEHNIKVFLRGVLCFCL
jgi:hypothetical protein